MEQISKLTKTLIVGTCLIAGTTFCNWDKINTKIKNSSYKKMQEMIQEDYNKLEPYIKEIKTANSIRDLGWDSYAIEDLKENPCLDKIANMKEVTNCYRLINGNKSAVPHPYMKTIIWKTKCDSKN